MTDTQYTTVPEINANGEPFPDSATSLAFRKLQGLRPLTVGKPEDIRRYGRDVYYSRPILAGGERIATWCGYAANLPKLKRYAVPDLFCSGSIHLRDGAE